jgi:hypothetical protein
MSRDVPRCPEVISGHLVTARHSSSPRAPRGISGHLWASRGILGHLGASWGISGHLGTSRGISGHLWGQLGASQAFRGISDHLGASRGIDLGVSRGISGHLGYFQTYGWARAHDVPEMSRKGAARGGQLIASTPTTYGTWPAVCGMMSIKYGISRARGPPLLYPGIPTSGGTPKMEHKSDMFKYCLPILKNSTQHFFGIPEESWWCNNPPPSGILVGHHQDSWWSASSD